MHVRVLKDGLNDSKKKKATWFVLRVQTQFGPINHVQTWRI